MSAVAKAKPIALGENVADIEIAARALAISAQIYLVTPNFPVCQEIKAARWNAYQRDLAELLGVVNHG